jgi:PAT family beta-lactamase induction signal transducer AmpG
MIKRESRNPWLWVPSLYVAEGLPYVMVMMVSGIMYKRLDISNTELALYTSWLYLPWVIKPLWSPVVDLLKTKRFWILLMQFFIGPFLQITFSDTLLLFSGLWLLVLQHRTLLQTVIT